jgi:hypothetical protein
MLDRSVNKEFE